MNVKAYATDEKDGLYNLLFIQKVKNKKEMRELVLNDKNMSIISRVDYGRKSYTMSDIYAGR